MKRFEELRTLIMNLESDFDKFYNKDNQAAGTRVRKGMQDLKNLAQDIRKEVQDMKIPEPRKTNPDFLY
ncbi:MAG: histone H1 [Bacteroidia bacterium]|nr:histone H1 [Bacteroidia bacterium]